MPGVSKEGGGLTTKKSVYGAPYKMKGNPMQRNFGIGSPMTKPTDPTKGQARKDIAKAQSLAGEYDVEKAKTKKNPNQVEIDALNQRVRAIRDQIRAGVTPEVHHKLHIELRTIHADVKRLKAGG